MDAWPTDDEEVSPLEERVHEAERLDINEIKDQDSKDGRHGRKRRRDTGGGTDGKHRDDDVVEAGMPTATHKKSRVVAQFSRFTNNIATPVNKKTGVGISLAPTCQARSEAPVNPQQPRIRSETTNHGSP